jgi:predicted transcriptional regulator
MPIAKTVEPEGQGLDRVAVTLHLDPARFRALEELAGAERRTTADLALDAVIRDLEARQEAARGITMLVAADAASLAPGPLLRTEGESDVRFAERTALMDHLFAIPDAD